VHFVSGTLGDLPEELFRRVSHYRHQVFIERLGWDLPTNGNSEQDQFDKPYAFYVVALNVENRVIGCARLLPTSKPYLLGEVFPQLLNGKSLPQSSKIWELSRFAAMDVRDLSKKRNKTLCSNITLGLLRTVISNARSRGVDRLITVSPAAIERLLRTTGYKHHRAGPPITVNSESLMAFWIECDRNNAKES
jgi:N-acyl-L-homoserine lactone synthetase